MDILETIDLLFKKDSYSMVLAVVSVIVSLLAFYMQRRHSKQRNRTVKDVILDLEMKTAKLRLDSLELPKEERKEIEEKLDQLDQIVKEFYEEEAAEKHKKTLHKQGGFMDQEFMLYSVPAIIALTFTFTLVYLLISNQSVENYQTPEILKTGITTIIGYYFGVAVKDKSTTPPKPVDVKDIQKQLSELIAHNKKIN